MKVPAYIDEALRRRTRAAETYTRNDFIISKFLDDNGLSNEINSEDFHLGVEGIVHPKESEKRIRIAIVRKR